MFSDNIFGGGVSKLTIWRVNSICRRNGHLATPLVRLGKPGQYSVLCTGGGGGVFFPVG